MPAFNTAPVPPPPLLTPGVPLYVLGAQLPGPTVRMAITNNSVTTNVVTLTVTILEGNTPAVGDLIYVYGTANSAGALNSTAGIAIASVSITAATGAGTITYPKTVSNQGATNDVGYALSTPGQTTETCASGKSIAVAIQNTIGRGYGLTWAYKCPSAPGSLAVQLEGAVNNVEAEYTILGSSVTTAGGAETIAQVPNLINFVRLNITAASGGTNPTIAARLLLS